METKLDKIIKTLEYHTKMLEFLYETKDSGQAHSHEVLASVLKVQDELMGNPAFKNSKMGEMLTTIMKGVKS